MVQTEQVKEQNNLTEKQINKEVQNLLRLSNNPKNKPDSVKVGALMAQEFGQSILRLPNGEQISVESFMKNKILSNVITPESFLLLKKDSSSFVEHANTIIKEQNIANKPQIKALQLYLFSIAKRDSLPQKIIPTGILQVADFEVLFTEASKNLKYSLMNPHIQNMLATIRINNLAPVSPSLNSKDLRFQRDKNPERNRLQKINLLLVLSGYRTIKTSNGKENINLLDARQTEQAILNYKKKFGIIPFNTGITKELLISLTKTAGLTTHIKGNTNQPISVFQKENIEKPMARGCADFVLDSLSKSYFGKTWNEKNKMRYKDYCGAGDAWTLCSDLIWKKGKVLVNVFDKPKLNLQTKQDIRSFIEQKLAANKPTIEKLLQTPNTFRIGDVVGLYYKDSPSQLKAYKERNQQSMGFPATYNTHVGFISGFTDTGEAIVTHYIHGHGIYNQPIRELLDTQNRTNCAVSWIVRPREMNPDHQLTGMADIKADLLTMI